MHDATTQSNSESDKEDWGGHPLFPRADTETGPDRRKFDRIQLIRYHADGTREVAPKTWKGSELHSWQQILDEYGGESTYQLVAQCGKTHQYSAWSEKWYFASPPRKPMGTGPGGGAFRQEAPQPQVQQAQPMSMNTQDLLLQMNLAFVKMFMEKQAAPQQSTAELLHGVAALLNGLNRGPSGIEMVKEMMPLMHGGERTSRTFMQGIDFARDFIKNAPAPEPARSNSDDLSGVMDLVKLFTALRPANSPAAAPPAPPPAPAPNPQQSAVPVPPCPPPPGYGWMFTQQGWVAFHLGMTNAQFMNRHAPAPTAPAQAPAAPVPQNNDEDVMLRKLLEHPDMRAKLQAMLAEPPRTPAPVPHPAPPAPPPAPSVAQSTPQSSAPVQVPPGATQVPAHALPDMLAASGWTFTPSAAGPVAMHFTKPSEPPVAPIPPQVSPAQPQQENTSFTIPDNVPMNDDLRAMLGDPEFQKIAMSVVGPESQEAFAKLVQQNAQHLQEMPEA